MMDLSIVTTCGKNVDIDEEIIAIVSISIDSYEFDVFFTKLLYLHEWTAWAVDWQCSPLLGWEWQPA